MDFAAIVLTKIQAVIREQRLEAVVERLLLIGVRGLTIGGASGSGGADAPRRVFRGAAYKVPFAPKVVVEWYGADEDADAVVRAIRQSAHTGAVGDGRIFVQRVEEAVRIRTGERGPDAT
jgi:nitrogen regulatory protein P-II 1